MRPIQKKASARARALRRHRIETRSHIFTAVAVGVLADPKARAALGSILVGVGQALQEMQELGPPKKPASVLSIVKEPKKEP